MQVHCEGCNGTGQKVSNCGGCAGSGLIPETADISASIPAGAYIFMCAKFMTPLTLMYHDQLY